MYIPKFYAHLPDLADVDSNTFYDCGTQIIQETGHLLSNGNKVILINDYS